MGTASLYDDFSIVSTDTLSVHHTGYVHELDEIECLSQLKTTDKKIVNKLSAKEFLLTIMIVKYSQNTLILMQNQLPTTICLYPNSFTIIWISWHKISSNGCLYRNEL